jgi:hypothetical protein
MYQAPKSSQNQVATQGSPFRILGHYACWDYSAFLVMAMVDKSMSIGSGRG